MLTVLVSAEFARMLRGGGERVAEAGECRVDVIGQSVHARGGRESNQCNYQCILDQVLAFFTLQAIESEGQHSDDLVHCCSPLD